jgi:hypothetical protein
MMLSHSGTVHPSIQAFLFVGKPPSSIFNILNLYLKETKFGASAEYGTRIALP